MSKGFATDDVGRVSAVVLKVQKLDGHFVAKADVQR